MGCGNRFLRVLLYTWPQNRPLKFRAGGSKVALGMIGQTNVAIIWANTYHCASMRTRLLDFPCIPRYHLPSVESLKGINTPCGFRFPTSFSASRPLLTSAIVDNDGHDP